MTKVSVNKVKIANTAFSNLTQVQTVDLSNAQFTNNDASNVFFDMASLASVSNLNQNINIMSCSFYNCQSFVNAPVIPSSVTDMSSTFSYCTKLINAPMIPNSVTNMYGTFYNCTSLVNAPEIPNSVTDIKYTFYNCTSLVNAPIIPNSVTNMYRTFYQCYNLVNAPEIPNSVTDMGYTFAYCYNLVGNIIINSNQITNTINCFYNTTLTKNVYIPFTYENGVNTVTYNSFISAGYKEDGSVCGVYLKDINKKYKYLESDLTQFTYTQTDNKYSFASYVGTSDDLVFGTVTEE